MSGNKGQCVCVCTSASGQGSLDLQRLYFLRAPAVPRSVRSAPFPQVKVDLTVAPPPPPLWWSRKRPAPPSAQELVDFYCELVGTSTGTTTGNQTRLRSCWNRVCPQGGANRIMWKNLEALFTNLCDLLLISFIKTSGCYFSVKEAHSPSWFQPFMGFRMFLTSSELQPESHLVEDVPADPGPPLGPGVPPDAAAEPPQGQISRYVCVCVSIDTCINCEMGK